MKSAYYTMAETVLSIRKSHHDASWLSPATIQLADEHRALKLRWHKKPAIAKRHNFLCREVKRCMRKDREEYVRSMHTGIERAKATNKSK